jgi:hypothetical protein
MTNTEQYELSMKRFGKPVVLTFQAANGYQEHYRVCTWAEYHVTIQVFEKAGFTRLRG